MSEAPATSPAIASPIETILRDELAHGDRALGSIGPILGHLVVNEENGQFNDAIVASVRGMIFDLARQALFAYAGAAKLDDPAAYVDAAIDGLGGQMLTDMPLLAHCHSLAIETRLAERLQRRSGLEPVLSPYIQNAVASSDAETSGLAMRVLAAQARFFRHQSRMHLPLGELPVELFELVLVHWRDFLPDDAGEGARDAEQALRDLRHEHPARLLLIEKLLATNPQDRRGALSIGHAGLATFITALAGATRQDRALVMQCSSEQHLGRFVLSLRAAGLAPQEIENQFQYLHPEIELPDGLATLRPDRAAQMLHAGASAADTTGHA